MKISYNKLWYMDRMLKIFCSNSYSELHSNRNDSVTKPTLK